MNVQAYKKLWDGISGEVALLLNELSNRVIERDIGHITAEPVMLATDCDEYHGLLLFKLQGVSIPAVAVSLVLTEHEDAEQPVSMKLSIDSFKVGPNGADFNDPIFDTKVLRPRCSEEIDVEELIRQARSLVDGSIAFESTWKAVNYWSRMEGLQHELTRRASLGFSPKTIGQIEDMLTHLGYRLDRSSDVASLHRWMSGPSAGLSYPGITTDICEIDTGLSFANVNARRDENFKKLQIMRMDDSLFAVLKGQIFTI